jgi:hypothetical protein
MWVLVNGSPTKGINIQRGFKQAGDVPFISFPIFVGGRNF